MNKHTKLIVKRILEIISEIESYEFYKNNLMKNTEKLYQEYQEGKYSYEEYKNLLDSVLKGKSKKEWIEYYNSYTYSLLKKIEPLLSQIIYDISKDDARGILRISEPKEKAKIVIKETEEPDYEFVEVYRPSMVDKLREAIKPKDIPEEKGSQKYVRPADTWHGKEIKEEPGHKRTITDEKFEERKNFLARMMESLKSKQPVKTSKPRKKSFLKRLSDHLLNKEIKKTKQGIKKKIERSGKPSLFSRITGFMQRKHARKASPVHAEEHHDTLLSRFAKKFRITKHHHAGYDRKDVPAILQREKHMEKIRTSLSYRLRQLALKLLPAKREKEVLLPKKKDLIKALKGAVRSGKHSEKEQEKIILKPEEDESLRKLVENVEKINHEMTSIEVKEPKRSFFLSLKIFLIRLHFGTRRITGEVRKTKPAKKAPAPKPEKQTFGKALLDTAKTIPVAAVAAAARPFQLLKDRLLKPKPAEKVQEKAQGIPEVPEIHKKAEEPEIKAPEEEKQRIRITSSVLAPIRAWYKRLSTEKEDFISKKTKIPHSLPVEALKKKIVPLMEEETIPSSLLTAEVEKIKGIMEQRKTFRIYQPSYFGSVANTLVRKFTFYLVDNFPEFFKRLYDSLRLANLQVLSNTYVNIMMFASMLTFVGSFTLFSFFFILMGNPLFIVVPKGFMMSLLFTGVVFLLFYMYPSIRAKTREKSINSNLPFAINHVSAVAGSGVPPTKMFKLLVESEEYGEVAHELAKIVEYVDLFGYDLLTAIRSVSITVPSEPLKEFLEGIVSTIESGSEIKDYLAQKSSEAMLSYELERQKYLETISTYSDVYTGILIAAPLFFIVALSLVSMLGGTIGGFDINLLIVLGAYVVIPVMNIIFIIFIELTQPEV